jgi:hypothetical protein
MSDVNVLAAIVAAASSFVLGGLWYSPKLFGTAWNRENGSDPKKMTQGRHPAQVFGISFVLSLIAAFVFALWLGPAPELRTALLAGLAAGAGFVATSFGINYQFASRSMLLWSIDGGYHVAQFLLFGLILGLWH